MSILPLHERHERLFATNRFVYPVVSRRSEGVSIGVNLNPDKICNFDCIYCQVDRSTAGPTRFVELARLLAELDATLELVVSGRLFARPEFASTPAHLRRLNDIAFSGDGEPTTHGNFDQVVEACAALKRRRGQVDVKMVLITNASRFHRPHVERGLSVLAENQGEVWAKLDAGTESYFRRIDQSSIPFSLILDNIRRAAIVRPLVIQAMFLRLEGHPPTEAELDAFCDRLAEIARTGGQIKYVQIYTVARRPADSAVTALSDVEVDAIVDRVARRTGLVARPYYGRWDGSNS